MNNADKQYQDLLNKILTEGKQKGDRTGTGTISIPFATLDFDMSEGFPLLTTKKVFTKAIVHELLWFLKGDTNIKYLEENGVTIWTSDAYREYAKYCNENNQIALTKDEFSTAIKTNQEFANMFGELGPVYGAQWRKWKVSSNDEQAPNFENTEIFIDQIQQVMDKLKNNPDDRRIMVSAWNIGEIDQMALPPCHYGFQLYSDVLSLDERIVYLTKGLVDAATMRLMTDTEKTVYLDRIGVPKRNLSLIWDQRSCDTFLGIPFNIASYGILLHMFAQQANMVPNRLIGSLKNVHVYNNHVDQCKEQIAREPRKLPILVLANASDLFSYKFDDVKFINYSPHDKIAGTISV